MGPAITDIVTGAFSQVVSLVDQFYALFAVMVGVMVLGWVVSLWRRQ